jgi:hypothetical protein
MQKITITLNAIDKTTGTPRVWDVFQVPDISLEAIHNICTGRALRYTVGLDLRACLHIDASYLGCIALDNGEFYPSSYFDNNPEILVNF